MPRRDFQVVPLSGEGSPFSTKLVEVKGHPAETQSVVKEADGPPMATPVVGKPGFVELSFDPRGLPYVDVRGVKPGSELQIVDPLDVGKTIRFRIPDEEKPEK